MIYKAPYSSFRGPKVWILGIPGVPPPNEQKTCLGPICTIMQYFTPIGATVAEISVTGHRKNSKLSTLPY